MNIVNAQPLGLEKMPHMAQCHKRRHFIIFEKGSFHVTNFIVYLIGANVRNLMAQCAKKVGEMARFPYFLAQISTGFWSFLQLLQLNFRLIIHV